VSCHSTSAFCASWCRAVSAMVCPRWVIAGIPTYWKLCDLVTLTLNTQWQPLSRLIKCHCHGISVASARICNCWKGRYVREKKPRISSASPVNLGMSCDRFMFTVCVRRYRLRGQWLKVWFCCRRMACTITK